METNNTTVTGNVTSAENKAMELKINFAKLFTLSLILVFFSLSVSNALDLSDYYSKTCDTNKSIKTYGTKLECLKWHNSGIDSYLNGFYQTIMKHPNFSEANKTALRQSQRAWLIQRDKECKPYQNNKTALTACYLDKTIPKVIELSEIDIQVNGNPFEGKWESCFMLEKDDWGYEMYKDVPLCLSSWLIVKDNNICGTWEEFIGGWRRNGGYILYRQDKGNKHAAEGVLACDRGENVRCIECYDRKNGTDIDFSNWGSSCTNNYHAYIYIYDKKNYGTRTPFPNEEKEQLIKENKWLQDCLNYKGE